MDELLDYPVRISIASEPAQLRIVRAALDRICDMLGFDDEGAGRIALAVDEALTNIIRHAYHGQKGKPIEIVFSCVEQEQGKPALRIELRDWGTPAEPRQIRSRDLDDIRPGGLGVHIINSVMDQVTYTPVSEGGTRLTMTKTL